MTVANPVLESQLEKLFRNRVRGIGGLVFKFAPVSKGCPDRVVLLPGGRMYLVELKTVTGSLSPAQKLWHERARQIGTDVHVVYGNAGIVEWVRARVQELDPPEREPGQRGRPRKVVAS